MPNLPIEFAIFNIIIWLIVATHIIYEWFQNRRDKKRNDYDNLENKLNYLKNQLDCLVKTVEKLKNDKIKTE